MTTTDGGQLELRGPATGLLDEPFVLRVRGAGPAAELRWRARYRDDDDRVWRAAAARCEDLATSWSPAKEGTGAIAALRSLRPLSVDVRVETPDGRAAARTVTRLLAGEGVRSRRWRDGLAATLHVPTGTPCATVVVDATAGATEAAVATLAASLLASRGVLALVVASARGDVAAEPLAVARERLAAVPGAGGAIVVLPALDPFGAADPGSGVVLPPGVGARDVRPGAAAERAAAWDALLGRLGAQPRATA
ncbi:MAG: hypothetical protein QOJ35_1663 [Solirubrobacteraceae bacterium]|nr:hypothetical protein [Solirubrobacteraceae bacterium]